MASIIINSAGVVLHADEQLFLDECRASNGAWVDHSISSSTATLIEGVSLPPDWAPARYRYAKGKFRLIPPPPATAQPENTTMGIPLIGVPLAPEK